MLRTSDLEYDLPEAAIAAMPEPQRDAARLMVISRSDPGRLEHRRVRDLPELLSHGDLMVFNSTRVLRARLRGVRANTGGAVEGLYLHDQVDAAVDAGTLHWVVLLRGRRLREGIEVALEHEDGRATGAGLVLEARIPDEAGAWVVRVVGAEAISAGDRAEGTGRTPMPPKPGTPVPPNTSELLEAIGVTPLPPYILKARRHAGVAVEDAQDRARYQTVYAGALGGSVAAPTAGLHFTDDLLERLAARGVGRAEVVLHVGTGTFRPVETEFVEQHPMHAEWCSMSGEARAAVARVQGAGPGRGRVIAVGTTSARTLESYAAAIEGGGGDAGGSGNARGVAAPESLSTRLLITPGYRWRWTDALLTNFHLPRSTLLAMVAALLPEGAPRLLDLYRVALEKGYRFYSYGDAMLVLP